MLFGDGVYNPHDGATFSGQARAFGQGDQYWQHTDPVSDTVAGKLPRRYGYEQSTIHTAEVCGLVASLRWRRPGEWNIFIGDRSALFQIMTKVATKAHTCILGGCCSTLETMLLHIMRELEAGWEVGVPAPAWRRHQVLHPEGWNIQAPTDRHSNDLKWFSKIATVSHGMVGVDIKSHQEGMDRPNAASTHGNTFQDQYCDDVRPDAIPRDIRIPAGGAFCYITLDGHMVTKQISVTVRSRLRDEAVQQWRAKPVQGKIANCHRLLYGPTMDIRAYTACTILP